MGFQAEDRQINKNGAGGKLARIKHGGRRNGLAERQTRLDRESSEPQGNHVLNAVMAGPQQRD